MVKDYQICSRCIMDTSDRAILFDESGVCNHCLQYERMAGSFPFDTPAHKQAALEKIIEQIKTKSARRQYDCIIGVSGGVDSTYLAFLTHQWGLRPLAVHLDNGWDSELAVHNIEKVLKTLEIDLYTYVLDWQEFKDLQISFLKASVSDAEIPTDHAIGAILYQMAQKTGTMAILSGANMATEAGIPLYWTYGVSDWRYIQGVHRLFGGVPLKTYTRFSLLDEITNTMVRGIRVIPILDYIAYNKETALSVLQDDLGWEYYGGKHYESIYTRFFQGYILPKKFGIDKRRAHFSSLIRSRQMERTDALEQIQQPPYPDDLQLLDREYVLKKLEMREEDFEQMMRAAPKTFLDYPNNYVRLQKTVGLEFARKVRRWLRRLR